MIIYSAFLTMLKEVWDIRTQSATPYSRTHSKACTVRQCQSAHSLLKNEIRFIVNSFYIEFRPSDLIVEP